MCCSPSVLSLPSCLVIALLWHFFRVTDRPSSELLVVASLRPEVPGTEDDSSAKGDD